MSERAPRASTTAAARQPRTPRRKRTHIRRRAEFQRIYEHGVRGHGRFSTIFILPNSLGVTRLGIAATRKLGGAVVRNRAKRLVRELFRRNPAAPGFDIVVIPKADLLKASFASLEADYRSQLARRLRQPRR